MVLCSVILLYSLSLYRWESKDLFTMKQNEEKWVEFENSMEDVITRSGLDKRASSSTIEGIMLILMSQLLVVYLISFKI
ncbi:hypothetical protein ACB098_02G210400 [Castanea mollissima]